MEPEQRIAQLEEKIDDLIEITEENNEALRSIKRTLHWSFWGKLLIWIVVLVLPFIVLGPLLRAMIPGFSGGEGKTLFGLPSQDQIKSLIDTYKANKGETSTSSSQ